jgi:hypothetical protein
MAPAATLVADEAAGSANSLSFGRTKDGKKLKIRSYPKFESLEEERLYRKQHLAAAFRVLVFPSLISWADFENDRFAERGFDEGVAGHM